MYSRITKIYYRKTVGHVFMKPVHLEGTTQNFFFPVNCFSSYFTFLPLGDATVCSEKIAALGRSSFVCWNITQVSLWLLCNVHFMQSTQRTRLQTRPFVRGVCASRSQVVTH